MDPAAGFGGVSLPWSGVDSRNRKNSTTDDPFDHTSESDSGGLKKLKKSASMTSLLSVFSRKGVGDNEDIPPVPPIPAEYAGSGKVATVEQFPAFDDNATGSSMSPDLAATSTIDTNTNIKTEDFRLKLKRSFKSLRSLTASSSVRPTFSTDNGPRTAPLQQGVFTVRGGSIGSDETYNGEVIKTQRYHSPIPRAFDSTSRLQTEDSMASFGTAGTRVATPTGSYAVGTGGRFEPRSAVFTGIGQQPPPDVRPNRRPAVITNGPRDILIAKSGATSMPHSDIADIDPDHWNSAVDYARRKLAEEEARKVQEAAKTDPTDEERAAQEEEARKQRVEIGTQFIKRTSRHLYTMDYSKWPDYMTAEELKAADEALWYWKEHPEKEEELKVVASNILKRIFKGQPSPGTPYPDIARPGTNTKGSGKPPTPEDSTPPFWRAEKQNKVMKPSDLPPTSPTPSSGFPRPPGPRSASEQRKIMQAQSSPLTPEEHVQMARSRGWANEDVTRSTQATRAPASRLPSSSSLKNPERKLNYAPHFGYNIPGASTSTRNLPLEEQASSNNLNDPEPEQTDSSSVVNLPQRPLDGSTPFGRFLKHKASSSTVKSTQPEHITNTPSLGQPPHRPLASSTSTWIPSLNPKMSTDTLRSPDPQRGTQLPQRLAPGNASSGLPTLRHKAPSDNMQMQQPQRGVNANPPQRVPPGNVPSSLPTSNSTPSSKMRTTPQPRRVWSPPSSDPPNRPLPAIPKGVRPWSPSMEVKGSAKRSQAAPKPQGKDSGLGLRLDTSKSSPVEAQTSSPSTQSPGTLRSPRSLAFSPSSQSPKLLRSPQSMTFSPSGRHPNHFPAPATRKASPLTQSFGPSSPLQVSKRPTGSAEPKSLASSAPKHSLSKLPAPSTRAASSSQPRSAPLVSPQLGQAGGLHKYRSATQGSPSPLNPGAPSTAPSSATAQTGLGISNADSEHTAAGALPTSYSRDATVPGLDLNRIASKRRLRQLGKLTTDVSPTSPIHINPPSGQSEHLASMPEYENTSSPHMDLNLPAGATDPYGDDESEMDTTPSKPMMPPPRRDFSGLTPEVELDKTIKDARDRAQEDITRGNLQHPALRGAAEEEEPPPAIPEHIQKLRRDLYLPPLEVKQPDDRAHPNHPYAWNTVNVFCRGAHEPFQQPADPNDPESHRKSVVDVLWCSFCNRPCCYQGQSILAMNQLIDARDPFGQAHAAQAKSMYNAFRKELGDGIEEYRNLMNCSRCAVVFCPGCGTTCEVEGCKKPLCTGCVHAPVHVGKCPGHESEQEQDDFF